MANIFRKASQIFRINNSDSPHSQAQHTQDISNSNDPPHNTPLSISLPTSPSKDIPRNILAFHTITKLLSQIQQERVFQVSQPEPKLQRQERLELKISNAFSTLAVIEHEVVAVVTKRTPEVLNIIACTQTSISEDPFIAPSHLLVTQNYHRSGAQPAIHPTREPTIADARILAGIDLVDDETLKHQVDEHW